MENKKETAVFRHQLTGNTAVNHLWSKGYTPVKKDFQFPFVLPEKM